MTISRQFKGIWIPAEIWLDRSLSYFEKSLLSEIHSLEGEDGCFASNEYLAEFFNERIRKIQEGIALLKERGYVASKDFDGRQRVLITSLNPKNDKSLFSTPDVRNSAPQTCGIPHPPLYIENKEEKTTTERPAASPPVVAVFLDKQQIHPCLVNVDIPLSDKIEITKKYPNETIVVDAISWATHKLNPPRKPLAASIKFACKRHLTGKEFDKKTISPYEMLCKMFKHGEIYNGAECTLNQEAIGFHRGMNQQQVPINEYFSFAKIEKMCNNFGIEIPKTT